MPELWREIFSLLAGGEGLVTATIFTKSGSAPRTAGAKMLVRADGSIMGTIGGGRLEGDARVLAGEVFRSRQPRLQGFDLSARHDMDMICGGAGEMFLDYHDPTDATTVEIYREIAGAVQSRGKCWLVTTFPSGKGTVTGRRRCLVKADGTLVGRPCVDPGFLQELVSGPARASVHAAVLADRRVVVEPIRDTGTVFIFGAGHVSRQIAPVAHRVGFRTVVLDDRAEYASPERFPASRLVVLESFDQLPDLPIDGESYLVIVTRGHLHDKSVLGQVLRRPVAYVGMIGSRRKRDGIYAALQAEGFTREELARVHSPIGLDILSETPAEIAVSIVAQLIQVRAERERHASR